MKLHERIAYLGHCVRSSVNSLPEIHPPGMPRWPKRQNVSINVKVIGYSVDLVPEKRQDTYSSDHSNFPADRKSTRLNSSHRCISYAVFCLKKKKTQKHTI